MADVNIQSSPARSGGGGAVVAVVVLVLLLAVGWFVFGRGGLNQTKTTKIEVNVPGASSGGGAKKP